jgi:hypothetical protein
MSESEADTIRKAWARVGEESRSQGFQIAERVEYVYQDVPVSEAAPHEYVKFWYRDDGSVLGRYRDTEIVIDPAQR